jgi:membrane-associated phospholipid phosphatase
MRNKAYIWRHHYRDETLKLTYLIGAVLLFCPPVFSKSLSDPASGTNTASLNSEHRLWCLPPGLSVRPSESRTIAPPPSITKNFPVSRDRFKETITTRNPASQNEIEENPTSFQSYVKPAIFVGGALAVTAILIRTDEQTYQSLYHWKQINPAIREFSPMITALGDGRASMGIFGSFLAYSYLANDHAALQAGKIGLESFLLSGIATQILKHTFGRERPSVATENGGHWNGVFLSPTQSSTQKLTYSHYDAFPSGHTATAFAAATTLAEVYHDSPWVSYTSYGVASGVAISRITERTHWLSDCFVGGLIGYFSTKLVLHLNSATRPVALLPLIDGEQVGLALKVGF